MSMLDAASGAAARPVSDAARAEATKKARWAAAPSDWLSLALDHHDQIRAGFEACAAAEGGPARLTAMKRLARVLNGHAIAEELVLYPALARAGAGDRLAAGQAYSEQTSAKVQLADLERLDPAAQAWLDRLAQIRAGVLLHMHQEESGWFLDLKGKAEDQTYLTLRFQEEFERYAGAEEDVQRPAAEPRSFDLAQANTGALDRH